MSAPAPIDFPPSSSPASRCRYCGSRDMQSPREERSLPYKLFSLYPFRCGRCRADQTHLRFSWSLTIGWLTVLLLMAAGGYVWLNPLVLRRGEEPPAGTTDALARARTAAGGLSAFEQLMINKPRVTMDNATVLKLWKANVGREVILQMIRTSNSDYDVGANAIIELKQAGVDQAIILAMIDASYRSH